MPEPGGLSQTLELDNEAATDAAGRALAVALPAPGVRDEALVVYLRGELGAGKTSLARGLLRGLGHAGRVPSPTYTLVEPYDVGGRRVYHIDLYRLDSPAAVEELGLGELPDPGVLVLIEWPDRAAGRLPGADLAIELAIAGSGRRLVIAAESAAGRNWLNQLEFSPTYAK